MSPVYKLIMRLPGRPESQDLGARIAGIGPRVSRRRIDVAAGTARTRLENERLSDAMPSTDRSGGWSICQAIISNQDIPNELFRALRHLDAHIDPLSPRDAGRTLP